MFVKNVRDLTEVYTDTHSTTDTDRIAALQRLRLFDRPVDPAFDRFTRLTTQVLHAPIALVTLIDRDRQFFLSQIGLPEPWASQRETPLSHSFCQHVVHLNQPLIITDAREHPLVQANPAIVDWQVIAYAGIQLLTSDGVAVGALGVIDHEPRTWTADEIAILTDLAASVMTEIELIDAHAARHRVEQQMAALAEEQIPRYGHHEQAGLVEAGTGEIRHDPRGRARSAQSARAGHGLQRTHAGRTAKNSRNITANSSARFCAAARRCSA